VSSSPRRKALITLVIGESYQRTFEQYFAGRLQQYAHRIGADVVVITAPLDLSIRAQGRSPSWQKCLTYRHPEVADYEQVAWIDSDIAVRPDAPSIFEGVPLDKIGAVNDYASPTPEDYTESLLRLYRHWDQEGVKYISNLTPRQYHGNFGLEAPFDGVVQCGVIVFSPRIHARVFESAYNNHEDKGGAEWNYEMRPLSYEAQKAGCVQWICPKFNAAWLQHEQIYYPFLSIRSSQLLDKVLRRIDGGRRDKDLRTACVQAAFRNNYFLHFSGGSTDYQLLPKFDDTQK